MIDEKIKELSANQQKALQALLTTTSVSAAAEQAGLARSTISRYLAVPEFARAYREARGHVLQEVVGGLLHMSVRANAALDHYLEPGQKDDLHLRAIRTALEFGLKGLQTEHDLQRTEELIARLEALEQEQQPDYSDWKR